MPHGIIHLLVPKKGLGILKGAHGEVFFDWLAVQGMEYEELTAGLKVDFELEAGTMPPRAARVCPLESPRPELPSLASSERLRALLTPRSRRPARS